MEMDPYPHYWRNHEKEELLGEPRKAQQAVAASFIDIDAFILTVRQNVALKV